MRQPHAGMAVAEPVAQVDHLHSCPPLSEPIPRCFSMTSFHSCFTCSMLAWQDSKEDLQKLPGRADSASQALVPTALPGVLEGPTDE
jgi:hypothetical protein